jgi:hypothetical protein
MRYKKALCIQPKTAVAHTTAVLIASVFSYNNSSIPNTFNPLANCSATAWLAASMY